MNACQHFLTDTEIENGRHNLFNFLRSKLDLNLVDEKLDQVFEKLDSAAKINIAASRNITDLYCVISKSADMVTSTLMKGTLFDNSMLLCTKADLTTIQNKVNKQDIIEVCTKERQNTKDDSS